MVNIQNWPLIISGLFKLSSDNLNYFGQFFICYLTVPQTTLGHCQGGILTNLTDVNHCVSDTNFDPKVTRSLVTRLDCKARSSNLWDLWESSNSGCNALTPYPTLPICVKVSLNMVYVNSFKEIKSSVSFVAYKACSTSDLMISKDSSVRT